MNLKTNKQVLILILFNVNVNVTLFISFHKYHFLKLSLWILNVWTFSKHKNKHKQNQRITLHQNEFDGLKWYSLSIESMGISINSMDNNNILFVYLKNFLILFVYNNLNKCILCSQLKSIYFHLKSHFRFGYLFFNAILKHF